MNLHLEYLNEPSRARLTGTSLPQSVWFRIVDLAINEQSDCDVVGQTIELNWASFLNIASRLAELRSESTFQVTYGAEAREQLKRFRDEQRAVHSVTLAQPRITADEVQARLGDFGFVRILTPEQRRDLVRMLALPNAANFSVPGAGKTTVAFAVNLLVKDDQTHLLVVAPKNAFGAWDDVLKECLEELNTAADHTPFVRLEGGLDAIRSHHQL